MSQENKNLFTGVLAMFAILMIYNWMTQPTKEQIAQYKIEQDSIKVKRITDSLALIKPAATTAATAQTANPAALPDSLKIKALASDFGALAPAVAGKEETVVFENEVMKVTFASKGGYIKEVELKKYVKLTEDSLHKDHASPVKLLEDPNNRFEYLIPTANAKNGQVSTADLYFTPTKSGNTITFKANWAAGGFFEQKYTFSGEYGIDYNIAYAGLSNVNTANANTMTLNWVNNLTKLEKNDKYERNYSSLYYKVDDKTPTYCSCTATDKKEIGEQKTVKWVSNANQFFNSSLIAKTGGFKNATMSTEMMAEGNPNLKRLQSKLTFPIEGNGGTMAMQMYVGPNDFNTLRKYNIGLEEVISYGSSILGTINRYVIRPIFDFLYSVIGKAGIAILLLTLLVKLVLYPMSYKMLRSQSKTAALKPEIEKLKKKIGDDQQKIQVETMKLYGEYGVNPLGGCLPTMLQMPIWMALFRFFPATLAFRQQSFLWATDLTGPEIFIRLPFTVPAYGDHISLFALLWAISLIVFTYYSTKDVDMSANPSMKYVQYLSPVVFMFAFNGYAAGLSLYMMFSNVLNIAQTLITKHFVVNQDKIKEELAAYKKTPQKKSAFRQKLDQAMEQQKAIQEQQKKKS
jgi:YidC/Oxa1 family membrane protein insertase